MAGELITLDEVQAWVEPTKLTLDVLDTSLLLQVQSIVLSRLAVAYPSEVPTWTTGSATPTLVHSVIAALYASYVIDRQYSEDDASSLWAARLAAIVEANIKGIVDGTVDLIEVAGEVGQATQPSFYPDDESSAQDPTDDDPSLGGPVFSMGKVF